MFWHTLSHQNLTNVIITRMYGHSESRWQYTRKCLYIRSDFITVFIIANFTLAVISLSGKLMLLVHSSDCTSDKLKTLVAPDHQRYFYPSHTTFSNTLGTIIAPSSWPWNTSPPYLLCLQHDMAWMLLYITCKKTSRTCKNIKYFKTLVSTVFHAWIQDELKFLAPEKKGKTLFSIWVNMVVHYIFRKRQYYLYPNPSINVTSENSLNI
jgi:hypothetical protein